MFPEEKYIKMQIIYTVNPIRSGGGGGLSSPTEFFALTHLILGLHYCALGTFPKK